MKTTAVKVQFYFWAPLVFAGFTALGALLTYQLMRHSAVVSSGSVWPLVASGGVLVLAAFMCGVLIAWLLFRPVELFLENARGLVPETADRPAPVDIRRGMAPITSALNRVTEILGNVEARALFPEIVAPSQAMRAVLGLVVKIAPAEATVLILGESGTGKELIARTLHAHSKRADGPFVAINCAGIPEPLLESELFGHEKGSFTGAYARKIGKLEAAHGGTVFLDEIGDMPMITQAKILRALQEREIDRVGGARPIPIDIRVIAATNKDLPRLVEQGAFREDLFFRIDVFTLHLPPLRERSEDIPLLATHLLRQLKPGATLSPRSLATLIAHHWPGNVRELKNAIEAAAALAGEVIEPEHLHAAVRVPLDDLGDTSRLTGPGRENLDVRLERIERAWISDALLRTGGVQVRAAALLGIKERSLWHRIAKLKIDVNALKSGERPGSGGFHHDMEDEATHRAGNAAGDRR
jgi:transcriptional regulator with PAS, ATPase and Fis domain